MKKKVDVVIFHVDANAYFASCAGSRNPWLWGRAYVVGGDEEARHGIVLAASLLAKKAGIKTGNTLWEARQRYPNLIVVRPDYDFYFYMTKRMRAIFDEYSDRVEPFGLDEAWIDLTGNETLESAAILADKLRERIKRELGITVSIGVASDKIMAKLGSDYKKPDATTVIGPNDIERIAWPLPASDLLCVGPSTAKKLAKANIKTIGELACAPIDLLCKLLGKNGAMIQMFARGEDKTPVAVTGHSFPDKSVGNSSTMRKDLVAQDEVRMAFWMLAESVAERLRENGFYTKTVKIHIRDKELHGFDRQMTISQPTFLASELVNHAMKLFNQCYSLERQLPIRSIGICGMNLIPTTGEMQMSMLPDDLKRQKQEMLEKTIDGIRKRFGHFAIQRAVLAADPMGQTNPKDNHTVHPVAYIVG
jgi:Nucleotidyltransferase/DNA polymerase involved in DNA repair